ncbi:MAG: efflux RND transporter periplasmic adaptor subunit [Phenylobacterium sp.]|uniref:efflux RND transporter periplasmic adaptor subunit n=1 Tax=Phenylobacterium sp. TaxID=1871053 RepID=UPI00391BEB51
MLMQNPKAADAKTEAAGPAARRDRRRRWLALSALVLLAIGAAGGGWALLRPPLVRSAVAEVGEAVDAVYASGVVEYVRQADVAPIVTAPIRQVLVVEGQAVRRGQTLAQLDDGPQLGTTLQLEAQAALARASADRATRLYQAGFGAKAAYEDALKTKAAAEAAAASARARLADYVIKAPFDGRVLRREAEPGDLARVGEVLFVVADPTTLRVTADVDERDVGRLAVGQQAVVRADAFADRTFPATVAEITPQGDSTGRTFRARLLLGADSLLKPGMTVETNLVVERRSNAVLVPTAAIKDGAVWTLERDRARRREVVLGAQGAERTEVRQGLRPGERVVLSPPDDLKDGRRVRLQGP